MDEYILQCILFDQDAFRDLRMVVADHRQKHWNKEYLAELQETSRSELLYNRITPLHYPLRSIPGIDTAEGHLLRQIYIDKVLLLGSNHDGLYLEKIFENESKSELGYNSIPDHEVKLNAKLNETDLDIVFEFHGIHITDNVAVSQDELYLAVEYSFYPGYVRLRISGRKHAFRQENPYLSPMNLKYKVRNILDRCTYFVTTDEPTGPAFQGNIEDEFGVFYADYVACLTMKAWPSAADSFINRDRMSGWPTPDIIADIVSTGCGFVAAGHRKSEMSHYEWRISFSAAEKMLIRKLTDQQIRAYLFFKSIFKTHLEEPEGLTSYMMKNILLWTIEVIAYENWRNDNILSCVEAMVDLLTEYLHRRFIPNYFVVKRNMTGHIKENILAVLYKKVRKIQKDVLSAILTCVDNKEFAGMFDIPPNFTKKELFSRREDASVKLFSMAYFTMYLNVRLQQYRYICALEFRMFQKCEKEKCRSLFSVVSPKAAWYLIEAIKCQPENSLILPCLKRCQNQLVLDISGFRTEVVAFVKSDLYVGIIMKHVFDDQELVTNETVVSLPEFEIFIDWADMTLTWQGLSRVNPETFIAAEDLD